MERVEEAVATFTGEAIRWAWHAVRLATARLRAPAEAHALEAQGDALTAAVAAAPDRPLPLDALVARFGLSALDRQLIVLLLAARLDPGVAQALEELHGGAGPDLTVGDVPLVLLGDPRPAARVAALNFLSTAPRLRAARLVDAPPAPGPALARPLRLTAAATELLLGLPPASPYLDAAPPRQDGTTWAACVPPEQRAALHDALDALEAAHATTSTPTFALLTGAPGVGKRTLAAELATGSARGALLLDGRALAGTADAGPELLAAVDRAFLRGLALVITGAERLLADDTLARALVDRAAGLPLPLLVTSRERTLSASLEHRWDLVARVAPRSDRAHAVWHHHLRSAEASTAVGALTERFRLEPGAIRRATHLAHAQARAAGTAIGPRDLERAAHLQLDADVGTLARTLHPTATLDALVAPEGLLADVRAILDAHTSWPHLMADWGLAARASTGRSIACLFSGEPGTGKTFTAEVIAAELGQPLQMVNLPGITSKWVGETEQNIQRLFAQAQLSGAVLLFDEADTLFGARVEAKTSNDHARNMLTGALLQELDRHSGLVILTTNLSGSIDRAFGRRLMFQLDFPRPDEQARLALWRGLIPERLPVDDEVDLDDLATRFDLTGGEIKNVVLRAAARAWHGPQRLTAALLEEACQQEYRRLGRLVLRGGR